MPGGTVEVRWRPNRNWAGDGLLRLRWAGGGAACLCARLSAAWLRLAGNRGHRARPVKQHVERRWGWSETLASLSVNLA